jgi:6-phosphogluconolactonase
MRSLLAVLTLLFTLVPARAEGPPPKGPVRLYVGTYTSAKSKGIYLLDMDLASGKLSNLTVVAETPNPTFLAIHPNKATLYSVNEIGTFNKEKTGSVSAFRIEKDGKLTELNRQPSGGQGPCHIVTDKAGKHVLVANYGGGSVASLPIEKDGKLGPPTTVIQHKGSSANPGRQKEPHAHSINLDRANRYAFAADLGTDYVYSYRFDPATGVLTANDPIGTKLAPGSGPRHFAFHPDGKHAFVINELLMTLTSFRYDADKGVLSEIETVSTLPGGTPRKGSTAEVVVHPAGKWVFGSNRGHNSIAVFAYDADREKLARFDNYGETVNEPRNFVLDPTGNFVLVGNQNGHSITVFRLNRQTGEMTRVGEPTPCPSPVCLRFRTK